MVNESYFLLVFFSFSCVFSSFWFDFMHFCLCFMFSGNKRVMDQIEAKKAKDCVKRSPYHTKFLWATWPGRVP